MGSSWERVSDGGEDGAAITQKGADDDEEKDELDDGEEEDAGRERVIAGYDWEERLAIGKELREEIIEWILEVSLVLHACFMLTYILFRSLRNLMMIRTTIRRLPFPPLPPFHLRRRREPRFGNRTCWTS